MRRLVLLLVCLLFAGSGWVGAADPILVPSQVATIQQAIYTVTDGGVIEIASGSYTAPSSGWEIINPARSFTIRAGSGVVTLSGGGSRSILRYDASNPSVRGSVVFENLIFADGFTQDDATVGGVTLNNADATFRGCTFSNNNGDSPNTGGGGVGAFGGSTVVFDDCVWSANRATNGGGAMRIGGGSEVWISRSQVIGNRSNFPGHRPSASAGGIDVNNASLWVANTRFEGNEAGFAGGAIFTIGEWQNPWNVARSVVVIANCTFEDNAAAPSPGVNPPSPTEGGAIHAEDQVHLEIVNSRFLFNDADLGGGISLYRAVATVENSVFIGNRALDTGSGTGFGGTIKVTSNDGPEDLTTNYPSAELTVRDTYIQGRSQTVTKLAQVGGGIFVSGDLRRNYGLNGSPVLGTPLVNRAPVRVERTVFADCDVDSGGISGQGSGGAMSMSLVDLDVDDTLMIGSDAVGTGSTGGAFRVTNESALDVNTTTFAKNTAVLYGGAVFAAGTELKLNSCQLFDNEISPGVSEPEGQSYGAAIFTAPIVSAFPGVDLQVTGDVSSSTLSLNIGMPVFDDDRSPSPVNAVRYNGNSFHNTTFSDRIYFHAMIGSHTVSQLNSLVVGHSGVDKAIVNNQWSSSAPILGAIRAVPTAILPTSAEGDASTATTSYLGYAWSGGNATLDGSPVAGGIGFAATTAGLHTLDVNGQQFTATVGTGVAPNATLEANPQFITSGGSSTLSWSTTSGHFVGAYLDRGLGAVGTAAGSVVVSPTVTTTYTIVVVTEEGGAVKTATVWVDEVPGAIFADGFETGNTDRWDSVSP